MCGIVGIIDFKAKYNLIETKKHLFTMSKEQEHRGPDNFNYWIDKNNKISFGFQRLSIQDLSVNGNQPMMSKCSRYIIVFNGEIYNFQDLRLTLKNKGTNFIGNSDTEVLLSAISVWGISKTIQKISGMYAFAIWDRKLKLLHLTRDRAGEKPLYYGWLGNFFLFSSELKALKKHPSFVREIDNKAVSMQLKFGNVPAPFCIYKNIFKLEPSTILTLKLKNFADTKRTLKIEKYWVPKLTPYTKNFNNEYLINQTEQILNNAIRRQCISDVPLGSFLSSGIDSSLVSTLMQVNSTKKIKTFSIGFNEANFNEARLSKEIAKYLGTDHSELYVSASDSLEIIPNLTNIYDEPFSDASQIPTIMLSKFAKEKVTVALTGDGGDELFGGYNRHLFGSKFFNKFISIPKPFKKVLKTIMQNSPNLVFDTLSSMFRISELREKVDKAMNCLDSKSLMDFYFRLLVQEEKEVKEFPILFDLLKKQLKVQKNISVEEQLMLWDFIFYLPNTVLVKLDRASMSNSLETRSPFLDHKVIENSLNLPKYMKVNKNIRKWVLKKILYKHIPQKYLNRPKSGFTVPLKTWLQGSLNEWSNDLLDLSKIKKEGYLDQDSISLVQSFKSSNFNQSYYKLWNIITFQSWLNNK